MCSRCWPLLSWPIPLLFHARELVEPAVVVGGFGGEEVGDFGVRLDQEVFFGQALHHALGDVFDRQSVRLQELMPCRSDCRRLIVL